jgi:hypothetical protein
VGNFFEKTVYFSVYDDLPYLVRSPDQLIKVLGRFRTCGKRCAAMSSLLLLFGLRPLVGKIISVLVQSNSQ